MAALALIKLLGQGLLALAISARAAYAADTDPVISPPGTYHTSWVGNSFGGSGAPPGSPNGFGYWVQDNAGSMAVSPDGTVFLGTDWDEAGRTVGLYKNGLPNRVLVQAEASQINVWGFNTANTGICVNGSFFYVATVPAKYSTAVGLLRFQWTPGDINSAHYLGETVLPRPAAGLSCDNRKIVVSYPDEIEIRDETTLQSTAAFPVKDLAFALPAPDGSFWIISDGVVRHLDARGNDTGVTLPGIGDPTSLAWGHNGQLIVTDNGHAQQVLFFDVLGSPKLVSTFGIKGGLYSGTPGVVAPLKLFALRGAGMDGAGNLYVAMSFSDGPNGNTFLRAFSPSGKLLWEDYAAAFVDAFGFEPGSEGTVVFGRTTRWQLNLNKQSPGSQATLKAITLDPLRYQDDPRIERGMSVYPRLIHGKQLLYALTQRGGGFLIFACSPGSEILHQVAMAPQAGFAWYVTDDGDIWWGDTPQRKIALYRLSSLTPDGVPTYAWNQPVTWPWPSDFGYITRVIYDRHTDSLYVFGYLKGQKSEAPGVLGFTGRRYDGWMTGKPVIKWTNSSLPVSPNGLGFGKKLSAKDAALSGSYVFLAMVRSPEYQVRVSILDANTGQFVGTLVAGPEVGAVGGDQDIFGSIHATRTAQGEYLILVEDDWRAKNILFRWKP